MINHIDLKVSDLNASYHFYKHILRPLGYVEKIVTKELVSFSDGRSTDPMGDIYLSEGQAYPFHFAFEATNRSMVDSFYEEGIKNGGRDNGAPGVREYHESYYAAYLVDLDGYRIEAVCHSD